MGLFDTFKKASSSKGNVLSASPSATNFDRHEAVLSTASSSDSGSKDKHLLFVGMPENRFQSLRADLNRLQPGWGCQSVATVEQAARVLQSGSVRTIISSDSLAVEPALASAIEKLSGQIVRVVLCESSDRSELDRWSTLGATPLLQNTDAVGLAGVINRLAQVQEWMSDAGMKKLLAQCGKLPVMPELYAQVTEELNSPNGSIDMIAHFISQDPVMAAKVLRVVNSAVFALEREVTDPAEAVMFLGLGRTHSLILLAGTFAQFDGASIPGFSPDRIWNHSLQVATLAQIIALEETNKSKIAEAAFTSGLMHDMGKLILAANVPAMCVAVEQLHQGKHLSLREAEMQVLGTTHAELAACLLGNWGLPLPVLEAVAWHHCPKRSSDTGFTPLTAVHAANIFACEMAAGSDGLPDSFDHEYLLQIGLGESRSKWRETCGLPLKPEEEAEHKRVQLRRAAKQN